MGLIRIHLANRVGSPAGWGIVFIGPILTQELL
jgi:hypothetical protein